MSAKTKNLCRTALLLAIAIVAQLFKNTSVYITGPVVNCVLLIAVLSCGLATAAVLCLITPLTAWLITGSPVMTALPLIPLCVMGGNLVLVFVVWIAARKTGNNRRLLIGLGIGSVLKAAFLAGTIVLLVLQVMGPGSGLPAAALSAARVTFSLTQLITALLGSVLAFLVWQPLKLVLKKKNA